MARYSGIITDDQKLTPIAGVSIQVDDSATGEAATLTADDGDPLDNPLTTDAFGAFYFNAADAVYDLTYRYGGRIVRKDQPIVGEPPAFIGPTGPANVLTIGSVTKIAAGGTPTAEITGTTPTQTLNIGLVTGDKGDTGPTGATGTPGYTSTDTWAHLNAITPSSGAGSTGFAVGPDTGTHTDANGATSIPNTGQFYYQVSPAGWIRIGSLTSPYDVSQFPNGTMARWLTLATAAGTTASATVQAALLVVEQQLRQTGLLSRIVRLNLRCGDGAAAARIPFVQRTGVGFTADTGTIGSWTEASGLTGATVDTGVTLGAAGLDGYNLGLYEYCLTDNGGADTSYTMGFGTSWGMAPRFVHDTVSGQALFVTFTGSSLVRGDIRRLIGGVGTYPILGSMMAIRQPSGLGSWHRNGIMLTGTAPASSQNAPDNVVPAQSVQIYTANVASGGDAITEGITPSEATMLHNIVNGFNVAIGRGVTAEGL